MTMPAGNAGNAAERSLLPSIAAFVGLYAALALPVLWRQEVPLSWLLASVVLALPLAVLSAIDLREYRLPDVLTLPLAVAGVLVSWWFAPASLWWTIASMVIGFALLAGVGMLYRRLRGRDVDYPVLAVFYRLAGCLGQRLDLLEYAGSRRRTGAREAVRLLL